MDLCRFGMNTVTLAGDLEAKLNAISNAGFHAIDWWAKDLAAHTGSRGSKPRGEEPLKREWQA